MDQAENEPKIQNKKRNRSLLNILLIIASFGILFFTLIFFLSTILMGRMNRYILGDDTSITAPVGIVFGAGITPQGRPYTELQARLDDAADALRKGRIQKVILSGDNRFLNYNEPEAMKAYLIDDKGVSDSQLQVDYAGRSTYETCERASKIFSVRKAILFSAKSHLPRAIFTCRSFGIESFGIGNDKEANNASRREPIARLKALFNIYLIGEETILGDKIDLGI